MVNKGSDNTMKFLFGTAMVLNLGAAGFKIAAGQIPIFEIGICLLMVMSLFMFKDTK